MNIRYKIGGIIGLLVGGAALGVISYHPLAGPSFLYPTIRGALNPDITQANINQTICNTGNWSTSLIRPSVSYTNALKLKQLAGKGNPVDYEEDHFISLVLGGSPKSEQNLWPEPYHTRVNGREIGARQKDVVEEYLHRQVCSGKITLEEAQSKITKDWYAVFLEMAKSKNLGTIGIDLDD